MSKENTVLVQEWVIGTWTGVLGVKERKLELSEFDDSLNEEDKGEKMWKQSLECWLGKCYTKKEVWITNWFAERDVTILICSSLVWRSETSR